MDSKPTQQPPNCHLCRHYYITHDANFRYGCRTFDFKSQRLPMLEVLEASGQACQLFLLKVTHTK